MICKDTDFVQIQRYDFFLTEYNIMWYFTVTETDEKEEVHVKCVSQRAAGGGIAVDGSRWNGLSRATRTGNGREDGEDLR